MLEFLRGSKLSIRIEYSLWLSILAFSSIGFALPVNIQVQNYQGAYRISGGPFVRGDTSLDLAAGSYNWQNATGSQFTFDVQSDGTVSSGNSSAASGGNGVLSLNNVSISVNPGTYLSPFHNNGGPFSSGISSEVVVPTISEQLKNDSELLIAQYQVANDGTVTLSSGSQSVDVSPSNITFKNISLSVNPGSYAEKYTLRGSPFSSGPAVYTVIPFVQDELINDSNHLITRFSEANDGTISVSLGASSVTTGVGTITFNTVLLFIDPAAYPNLYVLNGGQFVSGLSNQNIVVDVAEDLRNDSGNLIATFSESISGVVTVLAGQASVTATTGGLTLKNSNFQVNPGGYTGLYRTRGGPFVSGPASLIAIPYVTEFLDVGNTSTPITINISDVTINGITANPNDLNLIISGSPYTFVFTAGAVTSPPVANPGGPYSGTINAAVQFDGRGSSDPQGSPLQYAWQFGDGSTGTGATPTHAYLAAGSYTVTLTVTDALNLSSSANTFVTIITPSAQATDLLNTINAFQANGKISQATAQALNQNVYQFMFYYNRWGSVSGQGGGGGGCSGGAPNVDLNGAISSLNNLISQVGALFSNGQLDLQTALQIIQAAELILRAIAGDPSAYLQILQLTITVLGDMGVISPTDEQNMLFALSQVQLAFGAADPLAALDKIGIVENTVNTLVQQGVIGGTIGGVLSDLTNRLQTFIGDTVPAAAADAAVKSELNSLVYNNVISVGASQSITSKLDNAARLISEGQINQGLIQLRQARVLVSGNKQLPYSDKLNILNGIDSMIAVVNAVFIF